MTEPTDRPDRRAANSPPAWKRPLPPAWKRALLVVLGWVFVVLGVAGLFLPFLQGILFLLVGVYLLGLGSARARLLRQRARRWLRARYPDPVARVEAVERRATDWIRPRGARFRRGRNRKR